MERFKKFPGRLSRTIILTFLFPVIILMLCSGLVFYLVAKKAMNDEMGRRLTTIASLCALEARDWGFTTLAPGDEDTRTAKSIRFKLKNLKERSGLKRIYIFDKDNHSFADSDDSTRIGATYFDHALHESEINISRKGTAASSILFMGSDGKYYKSGFAPIYGNDGAIIGLIGVEASADFFQSLMDIRKSILLFTLIGIALTVIVGIFISAKIVLPIKKLVDASRLIGEGHFSEPVKVNSKNEIGFLAHTINEMRNNIVERDNRLKTMMHGIAHEVRNPLGGIELFAGLLKDDLDRDDEKLQYILKIESEIRNLKNLVEEFLDFSRSTKPIIQPVKVKDFAEELRFNFYREMRTRGVDFDIRIDDESKEYNFDRDQMKRALLNILKNSLEVTGKGETIILEFKAMNGHEIISVKDGGPGIPEENLQKIFDPFFTTKERGTGLGLSFAKKIVNSHDGDIEVVSNPGSGTTINIVLPAQA